MNGTGTEYTKTFKILLLASVSSKGSDEIARTRSLDRALAALDYTKLDLPMSLHFRINLR